MFSLYTHPHVNVAERRGYESEASGAKVACDAGDAKTSDGGVVKESLPDESLSDAFDDWLSFFAFLRCTNM